VDYGLTDKGLAKYDSERNGRSEGLYITWVVASALDDDRVALVLKKNPLSIGAAVRRLAQTLNTEFLRVETGTDHVFSRKGSRPTGNAAVLAVRARRAARAWRQSRP
jgi:hypothetical protein